MVYIMKHWLCTGHCFNIKRPLLYLNSNEYIPTKDVSNSYISSVAKQKGLKQGWIKCRSEEHRSQEMTRKIEEIITLRYEEKWKREEEEREEDWRKQKEEKREKERKEKKNSRNWGTYRGRREEHGDHGGDKLMNEENWFEIEWGRIWRKQTKKTAK